MNDEIWAGEVGEVYSEGTGEISGTAVVTDVDHEEKTVTMDTALTEMPADEEAAMKFTKLLPFVGKLGDALPSKGGLVRVLRAVAEFPLGATKPRLLNDAERQLFQIMMELNGYKSTVITSIMEKNVKAQNEAEALKQLANASTETDLNNG